MYEAHFGLTSGTFGTKAEGPAVFVGPQQADLIAGIHKGLAARDAIVTVTGPVGVGKTTVVNRALETIHPGRMAAWVGRMAISSEEVLELLLAGFGFKRKTNSTLQRFAAFRRLLHERASTGIPVAIVIEDARKLGPAALAEVEALTAADTADGGGANIILMGEPGLGELLSEPDLARLKQRIRRRQRVAALTGAEVQGYLKHAIRTAGGDYDRVFGAGVAELVTDCSGGIPRIINTLCETALNTAMEAGKSIVSAEFMHQVAVDAFGFEGELPNVEIPGDAGEDTALSAAAMTDIHDELNNGRKLAADSVTPPEPVPPSPVFDVVDDEIPESARNIVVESGRYPLEPDDEPGSDVDNGAGLLATDDTASQEPVIVADDEPTLTDIPDLINDTQPDLGALPEAASGDSASQKPGDTFDLDAALSPEVESTNMMPGVTANLDEFANAAESTNRMPAVTERLDDIATRADAGQSAILDAPTFDPDNLPTLSDSMRVEVANDTLDTRPADAEPGDTPFDLDSALESRPEPVSDEVVVAEEAVSPALADPDPVAAAGTDAVPASEPEPAVALDAEPETPPAPDGETASGEAPDVKQPQPEPADDGGPVMADPLTDSAPVIPEADLTALQAALDAVKAGNGADAPVTEVTGAPETPANVAGEAAGDDDPDVSLDQVIAEQQTKNEEMDQFAQAIGSAGSLEEISDGMAETLFGEEFDEAAAAAVAMGPDSGVAEGELVVPGASNDDASNVAGNGAVQPAETPAEKEKARVTGPEVDSENGLRDSVALRINVLNQMKDQVDNERTEVVEMGEEPAQDIDSSSGGPQPEPIERQINTSMTQTLEALNVAKAAEAVAAEKADKKSSGFFSRFRRSS